LAHHHLLVVLHRGPEGSERHTRKRLSQPCATDQASDPLNHTELAKPQVMCEIRFLDKPDTDCLTVNQSAISPEDFQRMTDRMAVVENAAAV
jgi:hypothetical protein